ncbi:MAG: ABC transporter permease [Tenericutes bacterium]|nr:ABC transporter permease [Mycoplasmatota bacterium]
MKFNDMLKISLLNIKSNKFKCLIYTLIILFLYLLLTITFSGTDSIFKFFDKYLNANYMFRTIVVNVDNNNREDIIENIEKAKIKEVKKIFASYNSLISTLDIEESEIPHISKSEISNASISAYANYSELNYKITNGRDIINENEIVCSSKFYPNILHDSKDIINLNEYLGKKINVSYSKKYFPIQGESKILKTYKESFILVGTYDIEDLLTDLDTCFISANVVKTINEKVTPVYEDKNIEEKTKSDMDIVILVDKYENIDKVLSKIQKLGYTAQKQYEIDLELYLLFKEILKYVCLGISIVSIIIVYLFIKNILNECKDNIKLFKLIGYNNKKIKSIFILEYLILTLVAFILHIFIIPFIYKFALNIISQNPDLFVLKIYVNCIGSLIYTLFVSLLVFIIFNIKFKKVLN